MDDKIKTVQEHIKKMLTEYNDPMDFTNDDGEGIVLDSVGSVKVAGGGEEEFNIELHTIYPNLEADTNIGKIDLVEKITDEDDWFTIEDIVKDSFDMVCAENDCECKFQK